MRSEFIDNVAETGYIPGQREEIGIMDLEILHDVVEYIVSTYKFKRYEYDEQGNWIAMQYESKERVENIIKNENLTDDPFNFRTNTELKKLAFVDALNMSLDTVKNKYIAKDLPIIRRICREDPALDNGGIVSKEVSDEYLDNLIALRWKENLKIWTIQWDNRKEWEKEKND